MSCLCPDGALCQNKAISSGCAAVGHVGNKKVYFLPCPGKSRRCQPLQQPKRALRSPWIFHSIYLAFYIPICPCSLLIWLIYCDRLKPCCNYGVSSPRAPAKMQDCFARQQDSLRHDSSHPWPEELVDRLLHFLVSILSLVLATFVGKQQVPFWLGVVFSKLISGLNAAAYFKKFREYFTVTISKGRNDPIRDW